MKKVFSITMIILFLLVSFQQALIIVHFKLNQQRIEQEFCINKSKPELQCHGKCHLKKDLENSENSNLALNSLEKKVDLVLTSNIDFKFKTAKKINSNSNVFYKEKERLDPFLKVFVPPPNYCNSYLIRLIY